LAKALHSCNSCKKKAYTKRSRNLPPKIKPFSARAPVRFLLATEVKNPHQESLGLLDMTVLRNGYGRQVHSDVVSGPSTLKKDPLEMVFIRGPILERIGPGVDVARRICWQARPWCRRRIF